MSHRTFSIKDWTDRHFNRVERYMLEIEKAFLSALNDAVRLAIELQINPDELFSFDDYPTAKERIERIVKQLSLDIFLIMTKAQGAQWLFANQKNDALVAITLGSLAVTSQAKRFMIHNIDALQAFQNRVVGGLTLSQRAAKYAQQFKQEIELGIDIGYGDTRSAAQLSRSLRANLKEPELLFRRVRSKRGNLVLSKAAQAYHPGQGTYRSSYKNRCDSPRTEINEAFRQADYERYLQLDFVVGFEIRRSNNPFKCDICEPLKGKYPKTFRFRGWHPQCRCFTVPILISQDEMSRFNTLLLAGQPTVGFRSENEVTDSPQFTEWLDKNTEKLLRLKKLPQFVIDNLG